MSDLNQCNFIGRLGNNPEAIHTSSGESIARFCIAVSSQWADKNGAKQNSTEWINCTAFGKLGEIVCKYLAKGSQVCISGRFKTDKFQGKDGQDRYATKIIVNSMQMLGGKPQSDSTGCDVDGMGNDIPF